MLKRIVIVVGEASGDHLGAQLAIALKKIQPSVEIEGVIGKEMIAAGCVQLASMDILSVMGLVDPILRMPKILRLRKWLLKYILREPPDLFIGIDAPDFNLGIERVVRKAGVHTVHYVSPSVWAWRRGRIHKIKRAVDLMLALLPFEADFYQKHKVPVCYTGHPLADEISHDVDSNSNRALAKTQLGFTPEDLLVAVLPGSRNSEIRHMTRVYLETIKACYALRPNLQYVMPLLRAEQQEYIEILRQKIIPQIPIKYVIDNGRAVMRAADCALVTSGTATLELMLHKVPMIVAYKTDMLSYRIAKRMVKVKFIALPNLLANAHIVTEYIQSAARSDVMAIGLVVLIENAEVREKQLNAFDQLHTKLQRGASEIAAQEIYKLIG